MDNDTHPSATPGAEDGDQAVVLERLGTALKEARLQRGIERSALASKLCMGEEQLTAIEDADQSKLPEAVFVIAQSRRVADCLGLDISLLIAPLKSASPRPLADGPGLSPARPRVLGRSGSVHHLNRSRPKGRGAGLRWLAGAALLGGLAAAGVWAWPTLQDLALKRLHLTPSPSPASPAKPKAIQPKPASKPSKPAVPAHHVLVSASQPSWLEVQTASKQVLFKGTFSGERQFPLGQGLSLLAGRPDLIKVHTGDGAAKPLGTIDQIRWVRVGATGSSDQPKPVKTPATAAPAPTP